MVVPCVVANGVARLYQYIQYDGVLRHAKPEMKCTSEMHRSPKSCGIWHTMHEQLTDPKTHWLIKGITQWMNRAKAEWRPWIHTVLYVLGAFGICTCGVTIKRSLQFCNLTQNSSTCKWWTEWLYTLGDVLGMGGGRIYWIKTDKSPALWNSCGCKMSDKHCTNPESQSSIEWSSSGL